MTVDRGRQCPLIFSKRQTADAKNHADGAHCGQYRQRIDTHASQASGDCEAEA